MAPVWAPDGSRLLFYSDHTGSLELYELNIADETVNAVLDASVLTKAGFEKVEAIDPWDNNWGAIEQYRASYSPDGEWIAFSREIDGDRELFAVRRDGTRLERLTRRSGLDAQPSWRPR
jgi:Tol biopolymer transport system component